MVQIQSSWFPLVDRNPQIFTEIPTARSGFQKGDRAHLPVAGERIGYRFTDRTLACGLRIHAGGQESAVDCNTLARDKACGVRG